MWSIYVDGFDGEVVELYRGEPRGALQAWEGAILEGFDPWVGEPIESVTDLLDSAA